MCCGAVARCASYAQHCDSCSESNVLLIPNALWFLFWIHSDSCYLNTTGIIRLQIKQDRQCACKRNFEARSHNYCCRGKAISISYSECVPVALDIHHANCLRHIAIFGHFSTLSHKWHDFRGGGGFEHKMCVWIFSTNFVWNILYSKKN